MRLNRRLVRSAAVQTDHPMSSFPTAAQALIAWRVTEMTTMGREIPELLADILLSDIEIMAREDFASDRNLIAPGNLGLAVLTMAMPKENPGGIYASRGHRADRRTTHQDGPQQQLVSEVAF